MNMPFYGAASITASQRSQLINIENSQGPGLYDITKEKHTSSSPKWSLKARIDHGSCFATTKENLPPPGKYQISGNLKQKVTLSNPNYRSQKHPKSNQKLAHLSDINIPSSIHTKSGSSFGFRDQLVIFKQTNYSPGPIYHPLKNLQNMRLVKIKNNCKGFGYGERNAIYKTVDRLPGPGAYFDEEKDNTVKLNHSATWSTFGKSAKGTCTMTNPLGPGEYAPKISNNGSMLLNPSKGFKLKGKLPQAQKYTNPNGPGSYDLPDTKSSVGPRFNHFRHRSQIQQNQLPNPFTYDCIRYPQMIDDRRGYSLGMKSNSGDLMTATVHNPGPGAYQVAENMSLQKSGGYMGRKMLKKKKSTQDDCFGKYDPKLSASARSGTQFTFTIDQKQCSKPQKDETLGPGHYELRQKRTIESYSMGTSQRFKPLKKQRGFNTQQKQSMNSTIGYMPSYMKPKPSKCDMNASKITDVKQ